MKTTVSGNQEDAKGGPEILNENEGGKRRSGRVFQDMTPKLTLEGIKGGEGAESKRMQAEGRAVKAQECEHGSVSRRPEHAGLVVGFGGNYPSGTGMQKKEWSLSAGGVGQTC